MMLVILFLIASLLVLGFARTAQVVGLMIALCLQLALLVVGLIGAGIAIIVFVTIVLLTITGLK